MKPPILDYETPGPPLGLLQRFGDALRDGHRLLCITGFGLLAIEPAVPRDARAVVAIIALGFLLFGAGIRDDSRPLT